MATIVFCHAHPDDEASQTSGAMARASDEGNRVVVVFGTNGEHGEIAADLADGETVAAYRRREAEASAKVLGVTRITWLGYSDSGMSGWEQNDAENSFHAADLDEAARRLADVLDEEDADVLVGYDWHGGYGHPDHVKVHHVVHRAADLAARRPRLLESTTNRTAMKRQMDEGRAMGVDVGDFDPDAPMDDGNPLGTPENEITWRVDVSSYLDRKRLPRGPPLPGLRHRRVPVDPGRGVQRDLRRRALPRAGPGPADDRRLALHPSRPGLTSAAGRAVSGG
jgi:LmbE family N-acetylglucosaminyl deacetylase